MLGKTPARSAGTSSTRRNRNTKLVTELDNCLYFLRRNRKYYRIRWEKLPAIIVSVGVTVDGVSIKPVRREKFSKSSNAIRLEHTQLSPFRGARETQRWNERKTHSSEPRGSSRALRAPV